MVRSGPPNKRMQLTKLRAAPERLDKVPPCAPAGRMDGGTASQLIRSVLRTCEASVSKADDERAVFSEFAKAARLGVEPESVHSEEPPLADISCRLGGKVRYFELTRVASQSIANEVGRLRVKGRRTAGSGVSRPQVYSDEKALRAAVERKAAVRHETHGARLDLVVYYDPQLHPPPSFEWVEETLRCLQAEYRERWGQIWLYDSSSGQVLA